MTKKKKPKRAAFFQVLRWPGTKRWVWMVTRGDGGMLLATSPKSWAREATALRAMHEIVDGAAAYRDDEVPF